MKQVSKFGLSAVLLAAVVGIQACKQEEANAAERSAEKVPAPIIKHRSQPAEEKAADSVQLIKGQLAAKLPRLPVVSVTESQAKGIYQVELRGGDVIHVTADANYIINGDLLAVKQDKMDNITEAWRSEKRIAALSSLKDEDLVVFQAEGEEKGEVIAFTDTSCGYCRKLHVEVPKLNAMGITVKYAAWPRYGVKSPAGQTIANIWCAADKQKAMTLGKTNKPVPKPEGECDTGVIQNQIDMGRALGVRGTPALFLADGRKVGGYRKASDLAAELGIKSD
ncbi:MAG: protein-disulfide isomerase [Gammaproteobacteria bacterium]|nr:MAG: protein-disulfide isomerase [Gammaproteobacteria bacterium]